MNRKEIETKAMDLFLNIRWNKELRDLEIAGFVRGEEEGKDMDVPVGVVVDSLEKQWRDFADAYKRYIEDQYDEVKRKKAVLELKRTLADLRNVAGCSFLVLEKEES